MGYTNGDGGFPIVLPANKLVWFAFSTITTLLISVNIFFVKQLVDELQRDSQAVAELRDKIIAIEVKVNLIYEEKYARK